MSGQLVDFKQQRILEPAGAAVVGAHEGQRPNPPPVLPTPQESYVPEDEEIFNPASSTGSLSQRDMVGNIQPCKNLTEFDALLPSFALPTDDLC